MGKVYTLAEVLTHNSSKDCWLIINGKVRTHSVFDVTKFLEDHPGGDEVLLASIGRSLSSYQLISNTIHVGNMPFLLSGKDAGDDFEDIGHSTTARAMMDEYCVGEIDAATILKRVTYTPPKQPHYSQDKMAEFIIRLLQFLVPLAILGLAVAVRFCTKSS
ncbi:hypothetical protein B296_00044204 [Ensete ventricosum]|uniref:Cytochrome b5 heme-binding domain-containing protein n=1 Tax=Ensete ventricosum TaxID=4639 RepID=A0A426Y711_ENSVE|nr:hypothetical protein B296_00044204 [Ensete ventricosum]